MPTARQIFLRFTHRLLLTTHLTLLAAILLLWPLSHFQRAIVMSIGNHNYTSLSAGAGRLNYVRLGDFSNPLSSNLWLQVEPFSTPKGENWFEPYEGWSYAQWGTEPRSPIHTTWLGVTTSDPEMIPNLSVLSIPFSFLTLLLLIYPALTYHRHRKKRHLQTTRAFPLDPQPSPTTPKPRA